MPLHRRDGKGAVPMVISYKRFATATALALFSPPLCTPQVTAAPVYGRARSASTISSAVSIPLLKSETIDATSADGRVITGVVDEDVRDLNGNVAIPRGSTAELMVKRDSD